MKIKAGIIGGRGVLGSYIFSSQEQFEWFSFPGDVTKPDDLTLWVSTLPKLEIIIHSAAVVPVSKVDASPEYAMQVNAEGVRNTIQALHAGNQLKNLWFFFPSTAHVYRPSEQAIPEIHQTDPISYYGKTKLAGESILQELAELYSFQYCIGRIFSYTAPMQLKEFVIPSLHQRIQFAAPHEKVFIKGATNIRDFLTAEKIATIIQQLALYRYQGIINIGSGIPLSIQEIAQEIKMRLNRNDIYLDFDNQIPTRLVANVDKLKQLSLYDSITLPELVSHYIQGIKTREKTHAVI